MKKTTASADPQAFARLQEIVRDLEIAMITTVTPDGALHSRPMVTLKFDEEGSLWFVTSVDSENAQDLAEEHAVNVSYADVQQHRYVSVTGSASLTHDREKAEKLWRDSLKAYFPAGPDDENLSILQVRIETAEFWDGMTFGRRAESKSAKNSSAPSAAKTHGAPRNEAAENKNGESDDDEDDGDGSAHVKVDVRAARESG